RDLQTGPEAERTIEMLVRQCTASVMSAASPEEVDPGRTFRELGLNSLMTLELRSELEHATGLRLPSTVVFDFPTPGAVAQHVFRTIRGLPEEQAPIRQATTDEIVAIVGMACRFPGDVTSPEDLWQVVESGADVTGDFPVDRGWNVDAIFD